MSAGCTAPTTTQSGGKQICTISQGAAGTGYTYNLWSNGTGTGCMNVFNTDATFSANWTSVGDFLARVGLGFDETKTPDQIGTLSSDFAFSATGTGGGGYVGIYGWTVNPLHEFYIVEDWFGRRPVPGMKVGTITVDDAMYDVYQNPRNNAPAITGGNTNFVQYLSVRQQPRTCGHISISDHFSQWETLGLQMGNLEEARLLVEALGGTGQIDFSTATVVLQ